MARNCKYCGKELEKANRSYCSRSCRNKDNPNPAPPIPQTPTVCQICGKAFLAFRATRMYCSQTCRYVAKKRAYKRKKQPQGTIWRNRRREVFREQNGICWLCGEPLPEKRFSVHHLSGNKASDAEDIVALHASCHTRMHRITVIVGSGDLRFEGKALDLLKEKGY